MICWFKSHAVLLGYGNQIIGVGDIYIRLDTWVTEEVIKHEILFGRYKSKDIINYLVIHFEDYERLKIEYYE